MDDIKSKALKPIWAEYDVKRRIMSYEDKFTIFLKIQELDHICLMVEQNNGAINGALCRKSQEIKKRLESYEN